MRKPAAAFCRHCEVFLDAHARCAAAHGVLEQPAYAACALVFGHEGYILPVELDAAAVGEETSGDGVEERRFASAVCADDGYEVAVVHIKRKPAQGGLFIDRSGIKGLADVIELQHVKHRPSEF